MSVWDNLRDGKYENKVPYSLEKVPVDEDKMTVRQAREHVESEKQRQRDQRRVYQEEEGRLRDLLRYDLEVENVVTGHPKANLLWSMAWDRGHSGGYSDVISNYEDLVELVK